MSDMKQSWATLLHNFVAQQSQFSIGKQSLNYKHGF